MGYVLLLKELPDFDAHDPQPALESLIARHIDGIIWAVPEVGDNRTWLDDQLADLPVPIIFITMQARPGLPVVGIDNYAGGRIAIEHLLEQGYHNIGHISGPLNWWEARQRKAGWQDALLAAGIQMADLHVEEGDWSSAGGEKALNRLLTNYPEMDALFVGNDQMALAVLQAASRQSLRVPQDLAVVGFDGLPETAHYWPPLTTIYQDQRNLGKTAVRELVRAIEASRPGQPEFTPQPIYIRPELITRESSTLKH
jgi:LacI family transcriptional regulator